MTGVALLAALAAWGCAAGVVAGLLGVGGGILIVPFLVFVADLTQHQAEATSLLVILPTAIAGSLALRRHGVGDLGSALRFGVVGAAGAAAGSLLALALPASTLRIVFAGFLGVMGVRIAADALRGAR